MRRKQEHTRALCIFSPTASYEMAWFRRGGTQQRSSRNVQRASPPRAALSIVFRLQTWGGDDEKNLGTTTWYG